MDHRCLIAGCGYTGLRLARRLQPGWRVTAIAHSETAAARLAGHGIGSVLADLDAPLPPGCLATVADGAAVAYLVPPPDSGTDDPRLERFLAAVGAARPSVLLYMCTTGVYGDTRGAPVTESSPLVPARNGRAPRCPSSAERGSCRRRRTSPRP